MNTIVKDLLGHLAKPVLSKIHRFKDSHRGEDCYLIGGGISIKWFDFKMFSDKTSIPCQYVPFHNDFHKLNVEHAILPEPYFFYPFLNGPYGHLWRNRIQNEYRKIITENPSKNFIINLSNYPVLRSRNVTFLFRDFWDPRLPKNFITNRIDSLGGSLTYSIILAIYFGFDHVYLVGYDYTHVPCRSLHWIEKGQGVFEPHENYQKEFFEIAKKFIDITTITLDGTSDFINSVTYKEHTGQDPVFRENTELVSDHYLKVLATWPDYTVF